VTGVAHNGKEILANYSGNYVYLFHKDFTPSINPANLSKSVTQDQKNDSWHHRYTGHSNQLTVKEVSFLGWRSEYVATGSDDGRVYIWDKETEKVSLSLFFFFFQIQKSI
jgi:DDB1- and CUL4-associated factor 8